MVREIFSPPNGNNFGRGSLLVLSFLPIWASMSWENRLLVKKTWHIMVILKIRGVHFLREIPARSVFVGRAKIILSPLILPSIDFETPYFFQINRHPVFHFKNYDVIMTIILSVFQEKKTFWKLLFFRPKISDPLKTLRPGTLSVKK